jgi:trimeric autotransporter adhesin
VYAAGRIARWDGSAWHPMGAGFDQFVASLFVYAGDLIAAGSFTTAGGVAANGVARWDGSH